MISGYSLSFGVPTVDDYRRLRSAAGLSARSATAATAGLANTAIGVIVRHGDDAVGMGRVIGDGGLFYQLVDIAVDPRHQGRGIGKWIVEELIEELRRTVPAEAYVSLIADGQANSLYAQFGFEPTAPASIGMAQWLGR